MTPLKILKQAVLAFEKNGFQYCLAGGHAASLYRAQERLTRDVDFAVLADPESESQAQAEAIITSIGLKPIAGFIPLTASEQERPSICMISSSPAKNESRSVLDILLPALPWLSHAVRRAQHNKIDFGFAMVPVITPEDLMLAKCYALNNAPERFQDLDDIKEIFESVTDMDLDYLCRRMRELRLVIPEPVKKYAPPLLRKLKY